MTGRVETEEIIAAYQSTGSVWKAARVVGLAGQTVHARLRAAGHSPGRGWSTEEVDRLGELAGRATIGQIADEFGRSYASIACKMSELGLGSGFQRRKKIPRGAGYDKASMKRHIRALETSGLTMTRYARSQGMTPTMFVRALEEHFPEWWITYREKHSDLPEAQCPGCGNVFFPSNARQEFCSVRCRERYRIDQQYFGGKRNTTIGLAEGVCQLCRRSPKRGLSSHHIFGKENDPDNQSLIALCSGCHNLVTLLGGRDFDTGQWEALITLSWMRKRGPDLVKLPVYDLYVCVDIDLDENPEDEEEAS